MSELRGSQTAACALASTALLTDQHLQSWHRGRTGPVKVEHDGRQVAVDVPASSAHGLPLAVLELAAVPHVQRVQLAYLRTGWHMTQGLDWCRCQARGKVWLLQAALRAVQASRSRSQHRLQGSTSCRAAMRGSLERRSRRVTPCRAKLVRCKAALPWLAAGARRWYCCMRSMAALAPSSFLLTAGV